MSHNSPINFKRIYLDSKTKDETFVGIRTAIGRLISIKNNIITVSIPCLNDKERTFEWEFSKRLDKTNFQENKLYFFQIYKIVGESELETHVQHMEEAEPADLLGMFLSQSMHLLYLGTSRLKLINQKQFKKLFLYMYNQVCRFCVKNIDEISSMDSLTWITIQPGFTRTFTRWIENDLYFVPPLLRKHMENNNLEPEIKNFIIQRCDEAFFKKNIDCVSENPNELLTKNGNRIFSSRKEIGKINYIYHFIRFLLAEKRFILGVQQNPEYIHNRDIEINWLKNKFKN